MTTRFTGWHMAAILIAFFAVVVTVNLTMATLATRTFGGKVVENSYVASQQYNRWLTAARRQEKLGWALDPRLDGQRHVVLAAPRGARISGFARHPLGREADLALSFGDGGRSLQPLPSGRWAVHLLVRRGADEARLIETLS